MAIEQERPRDGCVFLVGHPDPNPMLDTQQACGKPVYATLRQWPLCAVHFHSFGDTEPTEADMGRPEGVGD
jgi:hypothetical protein